MVALGPERGMNRWDSPAFAAARRRTGTQRAEIPRQWVLLLKGDGEMHSPRNLLCHAAVAGAAAILASFITYIVVTDQAERLALSAAYAQSPGTRSTEVITQALPDIAREMRISVTERDPSNASTPHRHPGHHTFGYVLEGTYEVKIDDGPLRQLKPGDSFYEPPGALHAVSRNPSPDRPVKYLIIQVGDPTKPRTIPQ
jgi:quercetin dioxygenase-like cupin family protein